MHLFPISAVDSGADATQNKHPAGHSLISRQYCNWSGWILVVCWLHAGDQKLIPILSLAFGYQPSSLTAALCGRPCWGFKAFLFQRPLYNGHCLTCVWWLQHSHWGESLKTQVWLKRSDLYWRHWTSSAVQVTDQLLAEFQYSLNHPSLMTDGSGCCVPLPVLSLPLSGHTGTDSFPMAKFCRHSPALDWLQHPPRLHRDGPLDCEQTMGCPWALSTEAEHSIQVTLFTFFSRW